VPAPIGAEAQPAAAVGACEKVETLHGALTIQGHPDGDPSGSLCNVWKPSLSHPAAAFSWAEAGVTGPELKQLREDLGEAIGHRLTVGDMAKICGLPPKTGADTITEWEAGPGPDGPVMALLSFLAVGCDHYPLGEEIISEGDAKLFRAMMRAGVIRRLG